MSNKHNDNTRYDTRSQANGGYEVDDGSGARFGGERVQPVPIATFGDIPKSKAVMAPPLPKAHTLSRMLDVPISLVFEVGRLNITIAHLMELRKGSYIDLRNLLVDVIDVRVDDNIIAQAEAISLQQRYAMRISEVDKIPGTEDDDNNA